MSPSPDVFGNKHAIVTVTAETVTLEDGSVVPTRFRIASTSGYLATLPACGIQHGEEDSRKRCPLPHGHRARDKHNREHCHGWHIESARLFAEKVLATYGAKKAKPRAVGKTTYQDKHFVPLRKSVAA